MANVELTNRSNRFKLIVIGEPSVGKTTLIQKYVKSQIITDYKPTVGASISKQPVKLIIDGEEKLIHLLIWDIAGQGRFANLHKVYYNGAHGVILMFDLTRPDTLDKLKIWYAGVQKYFQDKMPVLILAGNKADLRDHREVEDSQIQMNKMLMGIEDYFETCALGGDNVVEIFERMAERLYT